MKRSSLLRLSDAALLREFEVSLARNSAGTAEMVAYIAEIDRRRLYLSAGYGSMYKYCVGQFHLSESAAYKRIFAARLIRKFPDVYDALAEGRVHLSGLIQLMTHLRPENAGELLEAARHKSRRQIEKMLAERFPKADVPAAIREVMAGPTVSAQEGTQLSPGTVRAQTTSLNDNGLAVGGPAPAAATDTPRARRRALQNNSRHVPDRVKRAVWKRDGGQCTFMSDSGHRCEERSGLEFDHAREFARGGEATVENIRLRCRAHNQFQAERTFGAGFMQHKREEATAARARRLGSTGNPPRGAALVGSEKYAS